MHAKDTASGLVLEVLPNGEGAWLKPERRFVLSALPVRRRRARRCEARAVAVWSRPAPANWWHRGCTCVGMTPREELHKLINELDDKQDKAELHAGVDELDGALLPAALASMRAIHRQLMGGFTAAE
jgi:hypothetical protein